MFIDIYFLSMYLFFKKPTNGFRAMKILLFVSKLYRVIYLGWRLVISHWFVPEFKENYTSKYGHENTIKNILKFVEFPQHAITCFSGFYFTKVGKK